jgi:hypothetical protein
MLKNDGVEAWPLSRVFAKCCRGRLVIEVVGISAGVVSGHCTVPEVGL